MSFASKGFVISEIEKRIAASGGGGVSTSGDALSGDGTSGDPLAAAAVLEALVDGGGTATAGAGTVLDLSATGGLLTGDGSAAAPSLAFSAEPGTGFFRGGAGYAALAFNGTERFGFLFSGGASVFNAASPFRIAVNGNMVLSYDEIDLALSVGTTGALAFGTGANDPRLVRTGTDQMSVRDGSGNYGLFAGGGLAFGAGSSGTLVGALNELAGYDHVGNLTWQVDTLGNHQTLAADWKVRWSNSNNGLGTIDIALSRADAGIVLVEDGSGKPAAIRNKVSCVTSLATAAAPTLITPQQSNTYFDNLGAAGQAFWTLPTTWSSGLQYNWTVISTQGIRVQCSPNQTIVAGTVVTTTTSGYIESLSYGSHIQLTAITSGTFYVTKLIGDWSVI